MSRRSKVNNDGIVLFESHLRAPHPVSDDDATINSGQAGGRRKSTRERRGHCRLLNLLTRVDRRFLEKDLSAPIVMKLVHTMHRYATNVIVVFVMCQEKVVG